MRRNRTSIVLALVLASFAAAPAADRSAEVLAPGLKHAVLRRGKVATSTSYRILMGVFDRQSDADHMLERALESGVNAFPSYDGHDYRIVTPSLPTRAEAEDLKRRLIDLGFSPPLDIQEFHQDLSHGGGPWTIHVLEVDPKRVDIRAAHAYDAAIGLETTADLAVRRGAFAAVNGGYFHMNGLLAGDSQGVLRINGRLLSEPDRGRAAMGFYDHNGTVRAVFGRLAFHGEVHIDDGEAIPIDGLNRSRDPSEIVLYRPEFHRTTLTPPGGAEVIIDDGQITEVLDGVGSSMIPPDGMVLSIGGERVPDALPRMRRGAAVTVETELLPLLPDPEHEWARAEHIVGGGPLLLWKGRRLEEPEVESISRVFYLARHPRTAAGVRSDGTLLFVTVDGRRPEESVGMSIPELTDLMLEFGAVSAVNLDGGGSTTMVIEGRVANHPSGLSARKNADAILIFPKKQ